ncbi:MAG: type II toxin-antitoxin system RelE/ParE family toxin [Marinosulfonomonas sp.]|nr:type II toxin-antitoxin system RelE/ParE family toxin [Marinosulfonomonas sp.]
MIQSTRGKLIQTVLDERPRKGFPAGIFRRASALITALDAAVELDDLRSPPGKRLEALKGNRKGQYSVRINNQWRYCFDWTPSGPANVELVDDH